MADKIKVLLVDDETEFTEPLTYWLESKDYEVEAAADGKSAIELIRKGRPHIVFLDLRMPIMGGIETLRHIRQIDKTLPVVIITMAYTDKEKFAEAERLGISGFFPKKKSFEELGRMIEVTLRTHKYLSKKKDDESE